MSKAFLIDTRTCNGCRDCQIVCKDEHCDQPWLPYSEAQPLTGQFWMFVAEKTRGQVPVVKVHYTPTMCAHCAEAPCAAICPAGAYKRRDDGLLLIDPTACVGCGACVSACPIGAIYMNADKHVAQKCAGCAHLLDNGWTMPRCADACPHDAIQFVEQEQIPADAVPLAELAAYGPKVFYLGLPKRFVAGCIVDFAASEVVIGADIAVQDAAGATVASAKTDEFGDFIFEGLEPAAYKVVVKAEGFDEFALDVDLTEKDITLGDIAVAQ